MSNIKILFETHHRLFDILISKIKCYGIKTIVRKIMYDVVLFSEFEFTHVSDLTSQLIHRHVLQSNYTNKIFIVKTSQLIKALKQRLNIFFRVM